VINLQEQIEFNFRRSFIDDNGKGVNREACPGNWSGGFIGSHLVERLQNLGAQVRAFVRYTSRGDEGWLNTLSAEHKQGLEIVFGDLRDPNAVRQAVADTHIVFHLGALISIPYSYLHPYEVAEVNLMGTLNVLMAVRDLGVERLIHTSSSECMVQPAMCQLMRITHCKGNLHILPVKSALICWQRAFTGLTTSRW